jgi:hypothetical protein
MEGELAAIDPMCLYSIIKLTEDATSQRYCMDCNTLLQVDSFKANDAKRFKCHACLKATKRAFLSSQIQRAYNNLLNKARRDKALFGYSSIVLSTDDVLGIVTADQIRNFSYWTIVPRNPGLMLTKDNAIVIRNFQRTFLVAQWKREKNPEAYAKHLQALPVKASGAKTKWREGVDLK